MINFYNQVPSIYTNASRDFQYLSWLINIVLNAVKHNVDDLYNLPNTKANSKLTELLALTLGFKVKRNYNKKQLLAIASVLPLILKYKGSEKAVEIAAEALVAAAGVSSSFDPTNFMEIEDNCLVVTFPKDLVDIVLFMDLIPYILPAGMTCRVSRQNKYSDTYITEVKVHNALQADFVQDLGWYEDAKTSTGLSELFKVGEHKPYFDNLESTSNDPDAADDNYLLHTGLLFNTIIPVLENSLGITPVQQLEVDIEVESTEKEGDNEE